MLLLELISDLDDLPPQAIRENKAKILIKESWIDFYIKERITYPYIFINKFEILEEKKPEDTIETPKSTSTYDNENSDIALTDADLPF